MTTDEHALIKELLGEPNVKQDDRRFLVNVCGLELRHSRTPLSLGILSQVQRIATDSRRTSKRPQHPQKEADHDIAIAHGK